MIDVIPAIIPQNLSDLQNKIERVRGAVSRVQIDVCDGQFVTSRSWPYRLEGEGYESDFASILTESSSMPFWDEIDFEADLMVSNPEQIYGDWIRAGASALIFHIGSTANLEAAVNDARSKFPKENPLTVELGIAIRPSTDIGQVDKCVEQIDFLQCMGSDRLGHHGEVLDDRVYDQLRSLRKRYPNLIMSVDIGVNLETAPKLAESGATKLVSGSTIFDSMNIRETIELLKNTDTLNNFKA